MKKIIFGAFALILGTTACTNLDETIYSNIPTDKFPENPTQSTNLGSGAYDPLKELNDYGGWWFCQEVTTDEMVAPTRNSDWDDNGKWRALQLHDWDYETEAVRAMWERYYRGIAQCNRTIDSYLGQDSVTSTLSSKETRAKMLALRSFYHWLALDNYGDVPMVTSFVSAPEKPLRNTRASVYAKIVSDLKWSIQYLPFGQVRYAASKGMAQMTLARLYLNSKVYTGVDESALAIPILEDLIANGGYTLAAAVKDPFLTNNENCSENIFTAYYDGTEASKGFPEFNSHMRTLCYDSKLQFLTTVSGWNGFATQEAHFNLYAANDLRRDAYFLYGPQKTYAGDPLMDAAINKVWNFTATIPALQILEADGMTKEQVRHSGCRMQKYEIGQNTGQSLPNDFVFFRLTDAYLMLAELYANAGDAAKVKLYLDPIRTRAGLGAPAAYDLNAVKTERRMEMFYEGSRRQDMIRWGIFNTAWNCAWKADINVSTDASVFPVPKPQLDANENLALPPVPYVD